MTAGVRYLSPTALYVGERILELRTRQGLFQRELARRLHIDPSCVQLWERNKRPVPYMRAEALAAVLGVTLAQLIGKDALPEDPRDEPLMARVAVLNLPIRPPDPEPLPEPVLPPLKRPYECTCMVCGRGAGVRWTEAQAALWMQAGVLRCGYQTCRGAILIERADLGHIGSPARGRVA